jgi:hypothetical protein
MRLDDLDEGPLDYIKNQAADIKQGINTYTQARAQRAAAAKANAPSAQASAAQQKLTNIPSEPYFQNRKQQYLNRGNLAGRSETPYNSRRREDYAYRSQIRYSLESSIWTDWQTCSNTAYEHERKGYC